MGLLRWIRGDEDSATSAMLSAGLAEFAAFFQPSHHKQTEHVEESHRRRVDVSNGTGIDLDRGIAVIRIRKSATSPGEPTDETTT